MALTIANWTISVRFQRAKQNTTAHTTDTVVDELHRRQIGNEIARDREQAHTQWLLLGGNVNR